MERIRDLQLVKEGDVMHYNNILSIVSSIDIANKGVFIKVDNGDIIEMKIEDLSRCSFFRNRPPRYYW
jgi:hypothetical protein